MVCARRRRENDGGYSSIFALVSLRLTGMQIGVEKKIGAHRPWKIKESGPLGGGGKERRGSFGSVPATPRSVLCTAVWHGSRR